MWEGGREGGRVTGSKSARLFLLFYHIEELLRPLSISNTHTHTPSYTHLLTHSCTPSLTHSFIHPHTHSHKSTFTLPQSLPQSLAPLTDTDLPERLSDHNSSSSKDESISDLHEQCTRKIGQERMREKIFK